jgi:hypothetical protein
VPKNDRDSNKNEGVSRETTPLLPCLLWIMFGTSWKVIILQLFFKIKKLVAKSQLVPDKLIFIRYIPTSYNETMSLFSGKPQIQKIQYQQYFIRNTLLKNSRTYPIICYLLLFSSLPSFPSFKQAHIKHLSHVKYYYYVVRGPWSSWNSKLVDIWVEVYLNFFTLLGSVINNNLNLSLHPGFVHEEMRRWEDEKI